MSYSFDIPPDGAPHFEPSSHEDQLVLVKKGTRYVFDCGPGQESAVIDQLHKLVADPLHNFNWFDAAVISHRLGERMSQRLTQSHHKRSA